VPIIVRRYHFDIQILELKMKKYILLALTILAALTLPAFAGDDASKANAELQKQMSGLSKSVTTYSTQLNSLVKSLEALRADNGKGLAKAYESFQKNSLGLEKSRKETNAKIEEMSSKRNAYFGAWEKADSTISDPRIKQASQDRRAKVLADHTALGLQAQQTRKELDGFLNKVADLRKFLGANLTTTSVAAAKEPIEEALGQGRTLSPAVGSMAKKLADFVAGLS
jgi:hypothetical protein